MAIISFSDTPEEIWCVAGWALRQVLDDVISQYPDDKEMADTFEQAKTHGGLSIDLLQPEFAAKIAAAIRHVAEGILSGTIRSGISDQPYGDTATIEQYRSALKELLATIQQAANAGS